MSYTPAGQIRTRTSSNDTYSWSEDQNLSRSYTVNSLNQYATVGGTSLSYDVRGNLTNRGMYGYSSENLLTSAPEGVSLSYDPLGRLYQTSSSAGSTRFVYDGDQLLTEYNAGNQLQRRYVHGASADEPLVWYEGTGTATRRWLHADERGSIIAISDASGAQFGINRYDEHGMPASGNVGRFQFTGQAWMPEVRLYYFKARFYSASLGRFMQTDPIGYAAGMNLYAYVSGDVINLRDPTGLTETETVTTTASRIQSHSIDGYSIYMADFLETMLRGLTKNLELTQSTVGGEQERKSNSCQQAEQLLAEMRGGFGSQASGDNVLDPVDNALTAANGVLGTRARSTQGDAFLSMTSDAAERSALASGSLPTNANTFGPVARIVANMGIGVSAAQVAVGYREGGVAGATYATVDAGVTSGLTRLGWPGLLAALGYNAANGSQGLTQAAIVSGRTQALNSLMQACAMGL